MKTKTTDTTTLGQLEVGEFFLYKKGLFIKTQAFWDFNPGMSYGVIGFTERHGKVIKKDAWLSDEAEISPATFMDDVITTALVMLENRNKEESSKEGAK